MSFSSYAGLDFEDFVQDAECVVIEQEQAGQVFDTPEDRARYILTIAKIRGLIISVKKAIERDY